MRVLSCLLVLLLSASSASAQGILARSRIAPPPTLPATPEAPATPVRPNPYDRTEEEREALQLGTLALLGLVTASPLYGPALLLGDDLHDRGDFPAYPYAGRRKGYIIPNGCDYYHSEEEGVDPVKGWAIRGGVEDGHDFGSLNRVGSYLAVDTFFRIGASTRWDVYTESLGGNRYDSTTLGDFHVTFRIAQTEHVQFHVGVGGRWRFDSYGLDGGGSLFYSADWFPLEPLVLSASVDAGNLDRSFVVRARATLGIQLHHAEVVAGYDFLRIEDVNLQGPFLGCRLWF